MAVGGDGEGRSSTGDGGGRGQAFFRGISELVLDVKGRIAIPARHRDGLAAAGQGGVVITADHGGCLLMYPELAWESIETKLMALPSFDDHIRSVQRLYVGHAENVDIDAAGRILVPPALRRYAALDKRVVLVGQGRKLELWDETRWQAQVAKSITSPAGLPTSLGDLSL